MSAPVVVANLDGEVELARAAGHDAQLPERVLAGLAAVGSLLRVFACAGEALELPRPLDPARVLDAPGLPRPELVVRGDGAPRPVACAWMETPALAARARATGAALRLGNALAVPAEQLAAHAAAVAACTPRAVGLELAGRLGVGLPGAAVLADAAAVRAHVEAGGAGASPDGRWVLKADWTAAGRGLLVGGPGAPEAELARRIDRLAARHGPLLFEPWLAARVACGTVGVVGPDGAVRCAPTHVQRVDSRGRFGGVRLCRSRALLDDVAARALASRVAWQVGERLSERGLRGPYGVDALLHEAGGGLRLHPLVELNPRASFGHVAHALAGAMAEHAGWREDDVVELVLAREAPPAAGDDLVPLLAPGGSDGWAAWLARDPAGAGDGRRGGARSGHGIQES